MVKKKVHKRTITVEEELPKVEDYKMPTYKDYKLPTYKDYKMPT